MDMEILVSSVLRSHGFAVSSDVLTVRAERVIVVDCHPNGALLYTELDLKNGFAYNGNFFVPADRRHQGIGARLLAAHEEICRETQLTILINKNRNQAFWKKNGYRKLNPFWQMRLARKLDVEFTKDSVYKSF